MSRNTVEFTSEGYDVTLKPGNPITICEITTNGIPSFSYGLGVCKHGDLYDPYTGMEKALASALKRIPKDDRRPIWDAFFYMFPKSERPVPVPEELELQMQVLKHLLVARKNLEFLNMISSSE